VRTSGCCWSWPAARCWPITDLRQRLPDPGRRALAPPSDGEPAEDEPADGPCPYPGLASFEITDADWFFGRKAVVVQLLGRLAEQHASGGPLVVVGASGVGKSSLLHAGLLPAVA